MKGVLVPLPAPGAPPSQMISRGRRAAPDSIRSRMCAQALLKIVFACSRAVSAAVLVE